MATPTTRPWRARALAVIAAALAALAVWLVTDPLLGIDLVGSTAPGSEELQPITPAMVAGGSLVAALAGWALLALMHVVVAAVLIPIRAGTSPAPARPAPVRSARASRAADHTDHHLSEAHDPDHTTPVVPRLREAGCEVRVLSRRGRDDRPQPQP
jgi:hypothetical protein